MAMELPAPRPSCVHGWATKTRRSPSSQKFLSGLSPKSRKRRRILATQPLRTQCMLTLRQSGASKLQDLDLVLITNANIVQLCLASSSQGNLP